MSTNAAYLIQAQFLTSNTKGVFKSKHLLPIFNNKVRGKVSVIFSLERFSIGLFRYIKIQLDSESVRTKTKESG